MTKDIYAPGVGESVQIGQQTNSFSISLSDELLNTVKMSRVRNMAYRSRTRFLLPAALGSLKITKSVT